MAQRESLFGHFEATHIGVFYGQSGYELPETDFFEAICKKGHVDIDPLHMVVEYNQLGY